MKKYAIVTDSTVYLTKEQVKDNKISIASLNVVESTISHREVDVDNEFIFAKLNKGAKFTTSQPAPGEFLEIFEKRLEEGYEKIFVVLLSSNISGTYQSAELARNMLDDPSKVYLFDTKLAAYGAAMIAVELIDMINDGKDELEIIERIDRILTTSEQFFTVEHLFSLARGGRLSTASAAIGTVLRVKPIIQVIDGKLELVHKERTYAKVHKYMLDKIKLAAIEYESITFRVCSTHSLESATNLKNLLVENFPHAKITFIDYLGPVFSIHVGYKGYGLSWFTE
ncbi:MAG: DegV family protein [Candidatus Izimaplasma sp.]|nr:DegV family protein [Candidatus Izimaplasma bacterium]